MIKLFFLMPILMSTIWWWYLDSKGFSVKDGIKGFGYIFAFNTVVILFFIVMLFVTH